MAEIRIRCAASDDAAALARVHVDAWRQAYHGLVPDERLARLSYERGRENFARWVVDGTQETYVAEKAGEAVGFLTLGRCRDADVDAETVGEIWGMYLAPACWRQGIGTRLCRHGERIFRGRDLRAVVLWVFAANDRARRFYEAMGYAPDGATKCLDFGVPLEAVRYRREL